MYKLSNKKSLPHNKTAFQGRSKQILIRIADSKSGHLRTPELMELLDLQRSAVSGYLGKLREKGFIVTKPCPSNGRVKLHRVTPLGREFMNSWRTGDNFAKRTFPVVEKKKPVEICKDVLIRSLTDQMKCLLLYLAEYSPLRTPDLMQIFGLKRASVSVPLSSLRKVDFVVSVQSDTDKRVFYHEATKEGVKYISNLDSEELDEIKAKLLKMTARETVEPGEPEVEKPESFDKIYNDEFKEELEFGTMFSF